MQEFPTFQTLIQQLLPMMRMDEAMGLTILLVNSSLMEQAFAIAGGDPQLSQARLLPASTHLPAGRSLPTSAPCVSASCPRLDPHNRRLSDLCRPPGLCL
jgi:hypothetical protein